MKKFAKLFETEAHGQILVKLDAGDDGPELRFYFDPDIEGLNVCSVAISAKDTDAGWKAMQAAFDRQDADTAAKVVAGVKAECAEEFGPFR